MLRRQRRQCLAGRCGNHRKPAEPCDRRRRVPSLAQRCVSHRGNDRCGPSLPWQYLAHTRNWSSILRSTR